MVFRFVLFGLIMGLAVTKAQGSEEKDEWITELRTDCNTSMQELGYNNIHSNAICSCYVDKLKEKLAKGASEREEHELSSEISPPQKIDVSGMVMSCM